MDDLVLEAGLAHGDRVVAVGDGAEADGRAADIERLRVETEHAAVVADGPVVRAEGAAFIALGGVGKTKGAAVFAISFVESAKSAAPSPIGIIACPESAT